MQLRDYQHLIVNTVLDYYCNGGKENGIIAAPTATGKTLILAELIKRLLKNWSYIRMLKCVDSEVILKQNAEKMWKVWNNCPLGIYHAGLKRRELTLPVTFCGIHSVYKKASLFGRIDVLFIDEAHMVNDTSTTMYQLFIHDLKKVNPNLIVIGLSATPYRLGQGLLIEGSLFSKMLIDVTSPEWISWFIASGYLAPLVGRRPSMQLDLTGVRTLAGEFNTSDLEIAIDKEAVTREAIVDAIQVMYNRKSIIVFGTGNKHVEHISEMLNYLGETSVFVHSSLPKKIRDCNIDIFVNGKCRWMVNQNILLKGFDHPPIDGIVDLAPTQSVSRHIQKLGRGTRMFPGKFSCQYADYAGNRVRNGPFDNPRVPTKKDGEGGGGCMPEKVCDNCGEYHHISATECKVCGTPFHINHKLEESAADQDILDSSAPHVETFDVKEVYYQRYVPRGKDYATLKITYVCEDHNKFVEFISIENTNPRVKYVVSQQWLRRANEPVPTSVEEALKRLSEFNKPRSIRVWTNKLPYSEILSIEF